MPDMIRRFPNVALAEVPCPLDDCDATITIEGALVVAWVYDGEGTRFRLGSIVEHDAIELHMVEHGLDPKAKEYQ